MNANIYCVNSNIPFLLILLEDYNGSLLFFKFQNILNVFSFRIGTFQSSALSSEN